MALRFEGFATDKLAAARAIMLDARSVVEKAQKQVADGTPQAATTITTWFGTLTTAQKTELTSGIHSMLRAWTRLSFKITYGTACPAGENARVTHFRKSQGDVHGATFREARAGVVHAMTLCAALFATG